MRGTYQTYVVAHNIHNSVRAALIAVGVYLLTLEAAGITNLSHGPWHSDGNLADLREASRCYFELEDEGGELFQLFLPYIAQDLSIDISHSDSDEEFASQAWLACKRHRVLYCKGHTVKLSRWFSVWGCWEFKVRQNWHVWLLILVYIGLIKGWLSLA